MLNNKWKGTSCNMHFGGATHFKLQAKFEIPLFQVHIDTNALVEWLNVLLLISKKIGSENITFTHIKSFSHEKYWWDDCWDRDVRDDSTTYMATPTWVDFINALNEKLYIVGNCEDQYIDG